MKTRIIAFLTAVLMLLSMFVLASCKDDEGEAEESKKPLTPKEEFTQSIQNAMTGALIDSGAMGAIGGMVNTAQKDYSSSAVINVTKLDIQGTDLTQMGKIAMSMITDFDAESKSSDTKIEFELFGEKPAVQLNTQNDKIYIVDLLGVNEKPIYLDIESLMGAAGEEGANVSNSLAQISALGEKLVTAITNAITKTVEKNFDDSVYSTETKSVSLVNGTQKIDNAKVITMTLGSEKIKSIVTDFLTEIFAVEELKELASEELPDISEITSKLDVLKEIRIINTVVDGKSVSLRVEIDGEEDGEKDTVAFYLDFANGNCSLTAGVLADDGSFEKDFLLEAIYICGEGKESFKFSVTNRGETTDYITMNGTVNGNKHEGKFSFDANGNGASVDYIVDGDAKKGSFELKNLVILNDGQEMALPLELKLSYDISETKTAMNGSIKLNMEGVANIEISLESLVEYKNVTVNAVSDYVSITDVDFESMMSSIPEKFPTIASLLNSLGSGESGGDDEYVEEDLFTVGDLGIWLPEGFEIANYEGYDLVLENEDVIVFLCAENKASLGGDIDFETYVNLLHQANADKNPSEIYDNDGVPYFTFEYEVSGTELLYFLTAYEGEEDFWFVQFVCVAEDYEPLYEDMFLEYSWYVDPYYGTYEE